MKGNRNTNHYILVESYSVILLLSEFILSLNANCNFSEYNLVTGITNENIEIANLFAGYLFCLYR